LSISRLLAKVVIPKKGGSEARCRRVHCRLVAASIVRAAVLVIATTIIIATRAITHAFALMLAIPAIGAAIAARNLVGNTSPLQAR
jgi:hypothetical protein